MDLLLSVKRSVFRCDDPDSDMHNDEFLSVRKSVLIRDEYKCRYCGFQTKRGMEVHHLDDDHSNNDTANLVAICKLCHACCHIGFSAAKDAGSLIYLPPELGISQADFNTIIRIIYAGAYGKDVSLRNTCRSMLVRIEKLNVLVKQAIGVSDLSVLSDFLVNITDEDYERRQNLLAGVYFFPSEGYFSSHLEDFSKKLDKRIDRRKWSKMSELIAAKFTSKELGSSSPTRLEITQFISDFLEA